MTDNKDPYLQTLFADAQRDLEGEVFVDKVMAKTRFSRFRLPVMLSAVALALLICALLLTSSLQAFALLLARGLTTTLIDLGDGWIAWFLSPANTVGSLFVLLAKVVRMGQKKITGAF